MDKEKWLDFSTLSMFMTCPQKYFWRIKRLIEPEQTTALDFGSAIHEALASWNKDKDDEKALMVFYNFMKTISFDVKRNPETGTYVLRKYFDRWRDEQYKTIETEVGFSMILDSPVGEFAYIGKIDRYAEHEMMGKVIIETKTTSIAGDRWLMRGKPNLQLEGYMAGIMAITGQLPDAAVLDIIHIHENPKSVKPAQRIITTRTIRDIEKWSMNIAMWWEQIQLSESRNLWTRNTEACVPIMGYTCQYTELCSDYLCSKDIPEGLEPPAGFKLSNWHPYELLKESIR